MKINASEVRKCLKSFDFKTLFREHLGWEKHQAPLNIPVDGSTVHLTGVAHKRGFVAFVCDTIPDRPTRMKIDHQVTKSAREHFVIYTDESSGQQVWQWVRRGKDQPIKRREFGWRAGQTSGFLLERVLPTIAFSLAEEEKLTLPDVTTRATAAFDIEKVTKRFYERFQAEHEAFHAFIKGIKDVTDRDWYASVMLNRLMFCYFIQKKGLLDGDPDYLRNRLARLQQSKDKDKFWSFYRHFLTRLFHEGLGQKPGQRKKQLDTLIGRIPYLNGGLFDIHELEATYKDIKISDDAFERLFAFFDEYRWHLDERPLRENNEINPDVLGYIFEKYINQKQMGAYYTKEDITGYISQNTVLPFILDHAARNCAIAFKPDSSASVWRLLRECPDAYIYEPVRRGVIDDQGEVIPLPTDIEVGIDDVSKRGGWNKRAPEPFALPTETWREHVARRQRCLELRRKLAAGEVTAVNDLVTLNLDIHQFVEDVIDRCEGPELLRALWRCLVGHVPAQSNEKHEPGISILDPTCGSGAFLFAALNILEPLYEACLDRMESFVEDLDRAKAAGKKVDSRKYSDFKRTLAEVADHPNQRYFILKSIIVNNLYGVDIMAEACEICKLRLFLKLVAQVEEGADGIDKIEPLPDIDFNIRAGNTLVGFTSLDAVKKSIEGRLQYSKDIERIETQAEQAAAAFRIFREMQTQKGGKQKDLIEGKRLVRERLRDLDDELNRYLAAEYGVDPDKPKKYKAWLDSHQSFHWLVDFYGIMSRGGFDVIIGNPPYVRTSSVRSQYSVRNIVTASATDIYAWILERTGTLLCSGGRSGMIVPLSLTFSGTFRSLRVLLADEYSCNWYASFGRIPSALFSFDVRVRNTIHIGHKSDLSHSSCSGASYTTRLHRWFEVERSHLFPIIEYAQFDFSLWHGRIPKLGQERLVRTFECLLQRNPSTVAISFSSQPTPHRLFFKKTAYNWLTFCREMPPCYDADGQPVPQTKFGGVSFRSKDIADAALVLLNGKLMFSFWIAIGDDFDLTKWMFADLPFDLDEIVKCVGPEISRMADSLDMGMRAAQSFKLNAGKRVGNYNLARCRSLTDVFDARILSTLGIEGAMEEINLLYARVVRTDFDVE